MAQQTIKICTGCDRLNTQELGLNSNGEPYLACCPDNNYVEVTAVGWLQEQFKRQRFIEHIDFEKAKEIERSQIQKAFSDGQELPINNPLLPHYSSEEYYNNTYENNK
jgi:hypothetical protein